MGALSPNLSIERMLQRAEDAESSVNRFQNIVDALLQGSVKSRTTTAQPGSPANGDRYIIPSGKTGAQWGAFTVGNVAIYYAGWVELTRKAGWRLYVDDEATYVEYDGTIWFGGTTMNITAAGSPAQGLGPLTSEFNEVLTVAAGNDCVTLPAAKARRRVVIVNRGANTLQVFPASGDSINNGAADASITIAANGQYVFFAFDATKWYTVS